MSDTTQSKFKKTSGKNTRATFKIEEDVYCKFTELCQKQGLTNSLVLRKFVEKFIQENGDMSVLLFSKTK